MALNTLSRALPGRVQDWNLFLVWQKKQHPFSEKGHWFWSLSGGRRLGGAMPRLLG